MRTLATAGLALALLVPAPPAQADTAPTQRDAWAFVDNTRDDITRLQQPGGPPVAVSPRLDGRQISGLVVSQDGKRFTYIDNDQDTYLAHDRVITRNASGALVRTYDEGQYAFSGFNYKTQPHLSPSATRVVVTRFQKGSASSITLIDLTNGRSVTLAGSSGLVAQGWLTRRWLLATSAGEVITTSANGGGPHQTVAGLTTQDRQFAVSPDGSQLVWSRRTSADGADTETSDLYRAGLSVSEAGVATLTGIVQLTTGQDNVSPTWSRDGQRIDFVRATGEGGGELDLGFYRSIGTGKRGVLPAAGGSPAFYASSLSVNQVADVNPGPCPHCA